MTPVYAFPGSSEQQIGGTCPAGWVQMQGPRPSPHHVAEADGTWRDNSAEAIRREYTGYIQEHLDAVAQARLYDGILSLCSYATSADPVFAAEAQAGVAWRDAVWRLGYQLMDEVIAGERELPTREELLALLPPMEWPDGA